MPRIETFLYNHYKEIIYQTVVVLVLFIFFSFEQDDVEQFSIYSLFAPYKIAFFGNYIVAATSINYILLPKLYYKKKTILFFIAVIVVVLSIILIDEYVLEQIYFPATRGTYFPGILFSLLETLPLIIIMVAFKFAWDFNLKQAEIERLKSYAKESELQFLKLQINPHFLFNNLNNLYAYAIEKSEKTPTLILSLSDVLRYMLYDCQVNYVSLSKEIKHLKNFTTLNELQIEHRGVIIFKENILNSNFTIAPLILIVFIENAFKHSSRGQSEDIFIKINITVTEAGLLIFTCENNFLSKKDKNTSKGIGLENVRQRLDLLYPKRHQLCIHKNNNSYKIELKIHLNTIK